MTAIQLQHGPWADPLFVPISGMTHALVCDAASRRELVRKSEDRDWLHAVVIDRNTQMGVRALAINRLRRLTKEAK